MPEVQGSYAPESPAPFPRKNRTVEDAERATQTLAAISKFVADSFVQKVDYDVIPGTSKDKTLLKPGAEKIALFFDARPSYRIVAANEIGSGHVEYVVKCEFIEFGTNEVIGEGDGSCSTMEKKYRWRSGAGESTGERVPREYWDVKKEDGKKAQQMIGGPGFGTVKIDGVWYVSRKTEKVENPDIYDERNTVLKMAEKRACVAAGLAAGCLSGYFTQDMEEHQQQGRQHEDPEPPRERSQVPQERPAQREAREGTPSGDRPAEGGQRAPEGNPAGEAGEAGEAVRAADPTRPKASLQKILSLAFRDDTEKIRKFIAEATTQLFGSVSTLNDLSKESSRALLDAVQKGRIKIPATH
jgi:hypothetical protein